MDCGLAECGDTQRLDSRRVLACLQQAYSALREAVDLQRRLDPAVGAAAWVEEIHELRTVMSAAAQLVRSFDPGQLIETVGWSEQGPPTESGLGGVTPAALLTEAHNDLADAMDHLTQAATSLTAARLKLSHLT